MSKTVKVLSIVVGGVLLLAVVAAVAVSALFDPNDYKDEITSQVKTHTGRTVTLDGDLSLSFFPWLGVESGKVTVGNAPGFGDEPFATLDRVDVYVRLMPLLSKRVEARTVVLEGLRLNLMRNNAGQTNWADLLAERASAPASPAQGTVPSVSVAGLELRDSSVSWRDDQSKVNYLVDKISLDTGALALGQPLDLKAAMSVEKGLPGYTADLKLEGTVNPDLEKSVYEVDDLKLEYLLKDAKQQAELASGALTAKLKADLNQSLYAIDGLKLDYHFKDAKGTETASGALTGKVTADVGHASYAIDDVKLQGKVPLPIAGAQPTDINAGWTTARLNPTTQQLSVTGVSLKAMETSATISSLEGTNMIDAPQVKGVIDVPQLSLPRLLTTLGIALPPGMDVNALGNAALHGDFSVNPSAASFGLSGMTAEMLGMKIQGEARSEKGRLGGTITVPPFATAPLFKALGTTLPQDINVKAIDKLDLATSFDMDSAKGTLVLRDLKADLLGTTMTGDVQGSGLNGQPRYTGTVRVDKVDPGAFMAVFGKLMPAGLDARELGELALNTRFDSQSSKQLLQLDDLHMTLVGLQLGGNLTLSKFPAATEYNGDLSVEQFSPRALLKRFGGEPPVTADPNVLTTASGKARVSATATSGRFDNVVLNLDQTKITGRFAVDNFASPGYDFAVAIDNVDVDRYLPPPTEEEKTKDAQAGDVIIPVATLKTLKLGGKVTAGSMKLGGIRLSQLDASLAAKDGVARLDPVTATLYQGKFAGGFTADARASPPTINVKGKATDIGVGMFLKDLSPNEAPMITGKGSFNLELTGKGNSYKKNLRSSDGSIGFSLNDGALNGFDLGYTLCSAYNTLSGLPKPKAKDTKKTQFKSITGTSVVTNGVSNTNDLLGTTGFMKVTGKGNLNLPQQKLDYDMDATMTSSTKLPGCTEMDKLIGQSFPLDISGTITEPKVMPDFGKLAKNVLQKKVEDELKDKLLDKLGGKKKPPPKNP